MTRMLHPKCRAERPAFAEAHSAVQQQTPLTEHDHVPACGATLALPLQPVSPGAAITPILERRGTGSDENTEALKR